MATDDSWSNEKCLQLIDVYESHPELWDSKHLKYYTKNSRTESWQIIANQFETDIANIKRKICSLMGSFRAQKSKGKKIITEGSNTREVYISKWFAFEKMMFLLDQRELQPNFGSEESNAFDTYEIKYENDSEVEFVDEPSLQNQNEENPSRISPNTNYITIKESLEPMPVEVNLTEDDETYSTKIDSHSKTGFNYLNSEYGIQFTQPNESIENSVCVPSNKVTNVRKRKSKENTISNPKIVRVETAQHSSSNHCITSEADTTPNLPDNNYIFGHYVASKFKNYSQKTRVIAEHAINNILFEADMGWYENSSPQPQNRTSYS